MTGPEHYQEAERLLAFASSPAASGNVEADQALKAAQVHATLALAAATMDAADAESGARGERWPVRVGNWVAVTR